MVTGWSACGLAPAGRVPEVTRTLSTTTPVPETSILDVSAILVLAGIFSVSGL